VKNGTLVGAIVAAAATIAIALIFRWLSAGSGGTARTAGPESAEWHRTADNGRGPRIPPKGGEPGRNGGGGLAIEGGG
jgi:hypothetical protein